ncbi:Golgi apparatus membrane protein TVP38 [Phanerochaete sordida]|uniref:Golgi apparatus membrane protein TVP38 n=1 Tax=Phanerochaete sordida TaxID=48140 RepID=A0A9P3FZZ9_9APHY|nr:Golgi apparatus membrane protein TVP38 [Phanerochaete sordida]
MNSGPGYPPPHDSSPPVAGSPAYYNKMSNHNYNASDVTVNMRQISRTPSPTPSETAELKKRHLFDFQAMKSFKYWFRREWLWYYVIGALVAVVSVLFTVYHQQIVSWLQPAANWMHNLPAGWLIPIAIFFVISFPPLFGHEILAILCGLVWGLWPGFAIVAAGTFIGEIGNFYAFKYCCAARGEKMEKTKIQYACLARIVREGGFKIALIARFSAIPGHFTTAVFATCGMSIWTFMIAALLSLPKQFITVYLGVALEDSESGQSSTKDTIIKDVVIGITVVVTVAAMWYIYHLMAKVKPEVIYERRKARQAKLEAGIGELPYNNSAVLHSTADIPFDPRTSDSELPLTANFAKDSRHQQWDSTGRAVGYAPDPTLYAPQPRKPAPRIGSANTSQSSSPAPYMSERSDYRAVPLRQNTSSSTGSWDLSGQVGGLNAYAMSRQTPYQDPYAAAAPAARLPPGAAPPRMQQPQYSQSPPPMRSVGHSPVLPPATGGYAPPEQTPTQARFAETGAGAGPGARESVLPNPFGDHAAARQEGGAGIR